MPSTTRTRDVLQPIWASWCGTDRDGCFGDGVLRIGQADVRPSTDPTLDDIMTNGEPFRVSRNSDAPWVVLADGSMTGGSISFGEARLPPHTSGPSYHVHENEDEAAYVVDGTMTFRVGDETFEAGPGTLVWLPRGVPHTFANLAASPAWVFGTVTPAGLEGMFAEQAEYFASLTGPPDESRIAAIGARWGVTRVGPPLETPGE